MPRRPVRGIRRARSAAFFSILCAALVAGVACRSDGGGKIERFVVDTGDMMPTLRPGQTVDVLEDGGVWHGDVVVFRTSDGHVTFARLIAVSRDRVAIHNGSVWVNGESAYRARPSGQPIAFWRVPDGIDVVRGDPPRTWVGTRQGLRDIPSRQVIGIVCGVSVTSCMGG